MEKEKYRQQEKPQQRQMWVDSAGPAHCRVCGAELSPGAAFCEECGAPRHGNSCPSCGAAVAGGMALCPACGHPVTSRCTFCGAPMEAGQAFCGECGNPRAGITCPVCGTLNFRSFCRTCNHPLNAMAMQAVDEARHDPRYIHACKVADELAEIEDEIAAIEAQCAEPVTQRVLSERYMSASTRRLLDEFNSLAGKPMTVSPPKPAQPRVEPKAADSLSVAKPTPKSDVATSSQAPTAASAHFGSADRLEQLRRQHRAKAAELQAALDAMVPDAAAPPEEKRNYACARMVTTLSQTTRKRTVRTGWVCHRCQVWHKVPSECAFEEYGGTWQTDTVTETVNTTATRQVNL